MSRPKFRFTKRQLSQPLPQEKEDFGFIRGFLVTIAIMAIIGSIFGLWAAWK